MIEVTSPIVVTVLDTDGAPKEGLPVYAFDSDTYTGFNGVANASGEATFVLPAGSYRFRSDLNGTQFWSGEANHCDVPGCVAASVTVTIPVTVSVQDQAGTPYPDLPEYAFTGDTYTGFNGTSDAAGEVIFTLPVGDYRFRADLDGVQFWSGEGTTCTIPGCTQDLVPIPGGTIETDVTIDYTYDPLYRLTAADYSTGEFFHYTYDAVGNRLTQETEAGTNSYTYDLANRLTSVDGVAYTWDANGNLLSDGASAYSYDRANRLRTVDQGDASYTFLYDGLGNRVSQIVSGGTSFDYTLDLAAGLTQVLDDGTNTYLYGRARIGEEQPEGWQYHLGDALGSVRELTTSTGTVGLAQSFEPFGSVMAQFGSASTTYAFTNEHTDATGLVYLRARYYDRRNGRFVSRDPWNGNPRQPLSYNAWLYIYADPINGVDPSGLIAEGEEDEAARRLIVGIERIYGVRIVQDWGYGTVSRFDPAQDTTVLSCKWIEGNWRSVRELEIVKETLDRIARPQGMGSPARFRSAMGRTITIARSFWPNTPAMAPPGILGRIIGDVILTDYQLDYGEPYATFNIIHEVGHVWDHRTGNTLSRGLIEALETWICDENGCSWQPFAKRYDEESGTIVQAEPPPGTDPNCTEEQMLLQMGSCRIPYAATYGMGPWIEGPGWEDWAESFATYIYPDYWGERIIGLIPGGIRESYVRNQINSLP